MEKRIFDWKVDEEERKYDLTLRPKNLEEFIGQEKLKEKLSVYIQAAKQRKEALDHCLFHSPPGLGKTTLAYIIAKELGVGIKTTSGPMLEKVGDLAAMLTNLKPGDVFFIDEIHRLNRAVEEVFYLALEEYRLDIVIGQGANASTMQLPLPPFTLIGATTRMGLLTSPLRNRFGIVEHLGFYKEEELRKIVCRSAKILGIPLEEGADQYIACRSRGTPRIVNRLLRRIRDFAQVKGKGVISLEIAQTALEYLGIDDAGLDSRDRFILSTIVEKFSGGPVGVETLAVAISEEVDTLTDVYEPYLIQEGFIQRTPRGRVVTANAYRHLGIRLPPQGELFK
jgi:Holliday junction DNA helicase RuvB